MQQPTAVWPRKTREVQNNSCDSTRWNGFPFRDNDIVIASYPKTGSTWTQQIVGELIFRGTEYRLFANTTSLRVDARLFPLDQIMATVEAQRHRRFLKTHLPLDALAFKPQVKYLYVGRDGRDVAWSLYNHHAGLSREAYEMFNSSQGRVGRPLEPPSGDVVHYFRQWLDRGALPPAISFWEHNQGWWDAGHLHNVLLLHFNNLKANLPAEMRRIAGFLGIPIEEELWPTLVEHCGFDYMKKAAVSGSAILGTMFQEGANTFFHKGTNGRWRDLLSSADVERYEQMARENLSPECAHWLATGELREAYSH